jgi:hypothetical protein
MRPPPSLEIRVEMPYENGASEQGFQKSDVKVEPKPADPARSTPAEVSSSVDAADAF